MSEIRSGMEEQNEKFVSVSKISINFLYLLYLCAFLLENNIKMCKNYITVLISSSNVQYYITEFNMA